MRFITDISIISHGQVGLPKEEPDLDLFETWVGLSNFAHLFSVIIDDITFFFRSFFKTFIQQKQIVDTLQFMLCLFSALPLESKSLVSYIAKETFTAFCALCFSFSRNLTSFLQLHFVSLLLKNYPGEILFF